MPKRTDLAKIMVIGSGPIVIGQAAEFDYAGTQACLALKEEGFEIVLVNSNPATIMTDVKIADKVYMEPLVIDYLAKIIRKERPDAVIPSLGGQTGLNLVMQLAEKGILDECRVEVLGTKLSSIKKAEDRELFRKLCEDIGEPVLQSFIARSVDESAKFAKEIGYPVVLRPAFTLGGTGGGFAHSEEELRKKAGNALRLSPVGQVLIEKSVAGYKEVEYEVIRDGNDCAIIVCNMENIDPIGIHTGDSMVVAPSQTLTNKEYQMLRDASLKIICALDIEGGCNVQFALDPESFHYFVIEVNPRVSRSSALASKATGYPIARVSTKIAVGLTLDEIQLANTPACFEPALDYVVTKIARFPFDKFSKADRTLATQMKATGEVMAVGRTFEESFLKAVRSLEIGADHLELHSAETVPPEELLRQIETPEDTRIFKIAALLRAGITVQEIARRTKIDEWFLNKFAKITRFEEELTARDGSPGTLRAAKELGFSDAYIARKWKMDALDVFRLRKQLGIMPVYKMIDTCASEFESYVPYFYSTYEQDNESEVTAKPSVIVLGSGPIRIGQGVEFDYSTVHAIWAIREMGYEAIVINNNPETVSTDYTTSDKLYFEPLTAEDVLNIIELEKPFGVIVQLGGQTAINLTSQLAEMNVPILGTGWSAIQAAENREQFEKLLRALNIPQPPGKAVTTIKEGIEAAEKIGYPVLVRPSYVLGGRAMQIVPSDETLSHYLQNAVDVNSAHPVLIDKYIVGKEVEVDAICDGQSVFIPGIMEHIEKTGVHSGDSISVYPPYSLSENVISKITQYTVRLGLAIGIQGLFNIQFIVDGSDQVYIIEVNPRSSRSVPFLSKATGVEMANIATKVILGKKLAELGFHLGLSLEKPSRYFVKAPAFSFSKISGLDTYLGPEMKSTGEAIGYDMTLERALYKALEASGMKIRSYGTVFLTTTKEDREEVYAIARRFYALGFNLTATAGTAEYLREKGVKVKILRKISEGSSDILEWIQKGYIKYVINTMTPGKEQPMSDGYIIRTTAALYNVTTLTSLDTTRVLLNVLEDSALTVGTIDGK